MTGQVERLSGAGDVQAELRAGHRTHPEVVEAAVQCTLALKLVPGRLLDVACLLSRCAPVNAAPETRNARLSGALLNTATGIRTRVSAMRGRRPSPLDDSGANSCVEATKALRTITVEAGSLAGARPRARAVQSRQRRPASAISSLPYPRGCGGIGRRARFRSVSGQPGGGSSPLIRIATLGLANG